MTSNTLKRVILSTESTTSGQIQFSFAPRARRSARANTSVQNAVYAYIRAVRALGRTEINTSEVAAALSLSVAEVNSALSSLRKRGVKALNG